MWSDASGLKDIGERVIPDAVNPEDWVSTNLLKQHMARYDAACAIVTDKVVLDIACGSGYGSKILAEHGARSVLAVDIDDATIRYAEQRYAHPLVTFRCCGIDNISDDYDVIVCFETLEHVRKPQQFLAALHRRLTPNGRLLVSATTVETKDIYPFHLHDFTPESFENICVYAGFEVLERRQLSFTATAAQVRASMGEHLVLPRPATVLANPLRAMRNIANACLFRGLEYQNVLLTARRR
jgi:2-polyprenyl-3-methyl-5-hydroxy-6-metoxy-1,4-benzoquinol methylase